MHWGLYLPQVFSTNLFTWSSIAYCCTNTLISSAEGGPEKSGISRSRKISLQGDEIRFLISPIRKKFSFHAHFRGEPRRGQAAGFEENEGEMEDEDGGLFNIEVSSDESVNESVKVPRDFQSEEDFQRQRKEWKVKTEKGEVCKVHHL